MKKREAFNQNSPELQQAKKLREEREDAEEIAELKRTQVYISDKSAFNAINITIDKEGELILNSNEEPQNLKSRQKTMDNFKNKNENFDKYKDLENKVEASLESDKKQKEIEEKYFKDLDKNFDDIENIITEKEKKEEEENKKKLIVPLKTSTPVTNTPDYEPVSPKVSTNPEFIKMTEEIGKLERIGKRNKTNEEKIANWMEISKKLGLGIKSIRILEKVEDEEEKELSKKRENTINEIGDLFKNGINRVVLHGDTREESGELNLYPRTDMDARTAAFLVNTVAKIKYKKKQIGGEGPHSEFVHKGTKSSKNEGVSLYIDTGGEELSIQKNKDGTDIFIDHHKEEYSEKETSATELMYEVLSKNKLIKNTDQMNRFVKFITSYDNLQYVKDPRYNVSFLKNMWPSSLYGLAEKLPQEEILRLFKEKRDPLKPFTDEELENLSFKTKVKKRLTGSNKYEDTIEEKKLSEIIEQRKKEAGMAVKLVQEAAVEMDQNKIVKENREFGKILYIKVEKTKKNNKNYLNRIPEGISFPAAKALGYDTFISYNPLSKKIFINSQEYDLTNAYQKIKKILPEAVMVRGTMILPPKMEKDRNITEEQLLTLLELKQ